MALEEEMRHEMDRLERELTVLDDEIHKLYTKVSNLINIRKKKEYELHVLRENFGLYTELSEKDIQTSLARLLKESL